MPVAWPSLGKRETPLNLDWLLHFPVADDEFFFFFQIPSDENYSRKTATRKENKLQSPSRLIGIGSR
jgi:hypothetical protein